MVDNFKLSATQLPPFVCMLFSSGVGMSPEDEPQSPPHGFSSAKGDVTLSCAELAASHELGKRIRAHSCLQTRAPETDISW